MASPSSDIEPAAQPDPVEGSSGAGGSQEEPPREPAAQQADVEIGVVVVEKELAEEEEEGECGFCLYMKGGGCKDAFVAWEECVEAAEKEGSNMVDRCFEATNNLKICMDAHADYYAPVLQAEQAVTDQAEAAIAAEADKNKGEETVPSLETGEKKEDAVAQNAEPTLTADEKKEEVVEKAASSSATEETKGEAGGKVQPLS